MFAVLLKKDTSAEGIGKQLPEINTSLVGVFLLSKTHYKPNCLYSYPNPGVPPLHRERERERAQRVVVGLSGGREAEEGEGGRSYYLGKLSVNLVSIQ